MKQKTPEHCKGCIRLHPHPEPWCCYFGRAARKATGECKLKYKKVVRERL